MSRSDLHHALRTEVVETFSAAGLSILRVALQRGKDDVLHTLHAEPRTFNLSGKVTGAHVLGRLGFSPNECLFAPSRRCLAAAIPESFDHIAFGESLGRATSMLEQGIDDMLECGFFVGYEYFGAGGMGPIPKKMMRGTGGDGHNASEIKMLKQAEDDSFRFVMTFIEGEREKGWTFHYMPKQQPVSAELDSMLSFLGLRAFWSCPEAEFEPCYWRFLNFIPSENPFHGPTEAVHRWFDSQATRFSSGISRLLDAASIIEPFGMSLFPEVKTNQPVEAVPEFNESSQGLGENAPSTDVLADTGFDIAISFAGPQREHAEAVATILRDAGLDVFYDKFYPAQLWGKDLAVFFDDIFRNRARYCLVFVSQEYLDRAWTTHERRSAVARMIEEKGGEYILPVKVDDVELPGLQPTIGYVSLKEFSIQDIAAMVIEKLVG